MATDRWVLFDLDGTLFDFDAAERHAVADTLGGLGIDVDDEVVATYRRINTRYWRALERGEMTPGRARVERWDEVLMVLGVDGVDVAALAESYLGHLAAGTQLLDGAQEAVAAVAGHHPFAYLTNGLADVQRPRLAASALAGFPAPLVISEEVGAAKPDPAIFRAALEELGDPPPERVVMVGDNLEADIGGAARLGMTTVWVAGSDAAMPVADVPASTVRIGTVRELPGVLGLPTAGSGPRRSRDA